MSEIKFKKLIRIHIFTKYVLENNPIITFNKQTNED